MWINPETKQTYVMHTEIRVAAGNVSLPRELTDEIIASIGLLPVTVILAPDHDPVTQLPEQAECVYNEQKQRWETAWAVRALTAEEMRQRNDAKASEVRMLRNAQLSASDWTQVADAPVDKAAWAAHRQALRDITSQAGFPWDVQWPTQPE